jgi:hypothetical protein
MANSIAFFVGTWYVKWATGARVESGQDPLIAKGYTLYIGTGANGDFAPQLTDDYNIVVGFTLLDAEGGVVLSSSDQGHQPVQLLFTNGALRWTGWWEAQPVRIYISLGETVAPNGVTTYSIYASTTYGDPEQVGVWGADGNPHGG